MGNQQMVEIVKALARNARVLVLDEPTSRSPCKKLRAFREAEPAARPGLESFMSRTTSKKCCDFRPGRGPARRQARRHPPRKLDEHQMVSMMVAAS